jgi:hypothetical protein
MISADKLLKLAQDSYAQARATSNLLTRLKLTKMGDDYLKAAEIMRRQRPVIIQAVFPNYGKKTAQFNKIEMP